MTDVAAPPPVPPAQEPAVSPVLLEIIRHRLNNINDDAASTLKRVSGSQIAVEASDLNTVIMAADGRVVACGRYVLIQVASMHLVVSFLLEHYADNPGIAPGDQFITNDPYVGTLHQPDVVLAAPIFVEGTLVAWCASVVHQSDVGGPTPGGITYDARSIFDEAIPMAPIKIVEGGRLRNDVEREYLTRSRTPELNALDLAGQIAANRHTTTQVEQVCRRYGTTTLEAALAQLLGAGERQLRRRLRSLPDGRWRHTSFVLFHDRNAPAGERDRNYAVRLTMTKRGDHLELDFSGSDAQAPGAINATRPALVNFAMAGLLIYLCNGMPWVPGGVWPVVDIVSAEGTVVHARWPAGVAMSTSSTGQAVRVCVNACVARLLEGSDELSPLLMASCQSAGAGACTISGIDESGRPFATMTLDDISGGGGARADADGADSSGFTTSPGAAIANVEVNESYLPIRYLLRRELVDSGGPGAFRGGVGTVQVLAPYGAEGPVSVLSFGQGLQHPAAIGVAGGEPGMQSGFAILDAAAADRVTAAVAQGERRRRRDPSSTPYGGDDHVDRTGRAGGLAGRRRLRRPAGTRARSGRGRCGRGPGLPRRGPAGLRGGHGGGARLSPARPGGHRDPEGRHPHRSPGGTDATAPDRGCRPALQRGLRHRARTRCRHRGDARVPPLRIRAVPDHREPLRPPSRAHVRHVGPRPARPALRGQRGVRDPGLLLPVLRPPGRRPGRPGGRTRPAGHRAAGAGY